MDSGYDTIEIKELLKSKGYTVVTVKNLRNGKKESYDIKKISKKDIVLYNKRIINENLFAWIKQYGVLNFTFARTLESYRGLLLLAASIMIFNKNNNLKARKQQTPEEVIKREQQLETKRLKRLDKRKADRKERLEEKEARHALSKKKIIPKSTDSKILYEMKTGDKDWYVIKES